MSSSVSVSPESQRLFAVWNALAPPIRPSRQEIEWYARYWTGGEGARVLIQGITPELVDLAVRKHASRVIAMDWREPMFSAMRRLGREDWSHVETQANDWRTFVQEIEGALDIILGDGSLTMLVFPEGWEQVLLGLRRYLVPGGIAILRLPFQPEEPLDFDFYLRDILAHFDKECAETTPEKRARMLRELISEFRIASCLASVGPTGTINFNCRADLIHLFHTEFTTRYGHWPEWETIRIALPSETAIRKGEQAGKAFPRWEAAVSLMEGCGFCVRSVEWTGTRPAPGVMRLFAAERM